MLTVLYDGMCVICRQSKGIITALDWRRRVEFIDLHQWELVAARYPDLDFETALGQMHIVGEDGRLVGGFKAVRQLLREVPLGWPFWVLFHLPGMTWLGEWAYRFIARHRYRVNRLLGVECAADGCKIST